MWTSLLWTMPLLLSGSVTGLTGENAAFTPREHGSIRAENAPGIDGRLDDAAWERAEPLSDFTQSFPDPGKPASFPTQVRVLHDSEAIYIAAHCQDPDPAQIVARVTRRDRWIESDWFQVEIDSRHDRRNGYYFAVNAAGVKVDGLLFDESQESADWDGVWEAQAQQNGDSWDVEMRIPLSLLRFEAGPDVSFGVNFVRRISRLNEYDQWQYIPPESGMRVSRFGVLKGLDLPDQSVRVEVTPYLASRVGLEEVPADSSIRAFDVGLDGKLNLGSNFMLTLTANPDFGQVEADQIVLNLSTTETYYPEKRPFFLEDMAMFTNFRMGDGPRADLFYTRRVGRAPRPIDLADGEEQVRAPKIPRIYGAAKLAGRTEGGFSVGLLQAVTSQENAGVRLAAGGEGGRLAEPLTSFSVLRLRQGFGDNSSLGLMATALATPADGQSVTGGTDLQLELADGSYNLTVLTQFSYLSPERYAWQDSFTRAAIARDGPLGFGADAIFWKRSGEHFIGGAMLTYRSPSLALNDVGYLDRPDMIFPVLWGQYRYLKPFGPVAKMQVNVNAWLIKNNRFANLGDGGNLNATFTFRNNWVANASIGLEPPHCDDRETRTGGDVLYCRTRMGMEPGLSITTDPSQPVSGGLELYYGWTARGDMVIVATPLSFTPISRLQLELIPRYQYADGGLRWLETQKTLDGDRFIFAEQHNEYWDVTVRGTVTFTTTLTLQAYAQVFLAAVDNREKLASPVPAGSAIHANQFVPAPDIADAYDFSAANFNLAAVIRWEFLPGSLGYLVYTGAFGRAINQPDFRFGGSLGDLFAARAAHTLMVKVSYLWG